MGRAKDLILKSIAAKDANRIIRALHYSGRVVNTSRLHFGVFLDDKCGGAMQFGPSMKTREMIPLVKGTPWNGYLELNRMAFADWLPRNGESRSIGYVMRLIRKRYPHVQWIVSFADGTQCGDGTIYRACGFSLLQIKPNKSLYRLPSGRVINNLNMTGKYMLAELKRRTDVSSSWSYQKNARILKAQPLSGYQLKYIYFLDPTARDRLTVPILPFSEIDKRGAGMYLGEKRKQGASSETGDTPGDQPGEGGSTPTDALHSSGHHDGEANA